ncbi:MAG: TRAP transporter substrate-binding protein DctP [Kiloniellales bacterium]
MKRIVFVPLLALMVLVATHLPAGAATIKLGTLAPEGSPWHEILIDMVEAWEQASGGTVKVRIYPGGVAGDEPDMVRKMRIGQLHAAALTGVGLSEIAPEILALQMPMMFASDDELDYVRNAMGERLEAILESKGFKVLTWGDAGWVRFFAQDPVVDPEDLKPMKIFTWAGDTAVTDAYKAAGYQPVPLAATEIHSALQAGLINALPTTPIAALSFQWFGLAKNMTDLKWAPLIGAIVISTRKWQAIPADLRPQLLRIARDAGARLQKSVRQLGRDAIDVMKKHGLVVHRVPENVRAHWERSARNGYAELVGSYVSPEMLAEVERLRDEYRAKHPNR